MKWLIIFLLIPFVSRGQTVHIKDGRIFYENNIKAENISNENISAAIQKALTKTDSKQRDISSINSEGEIIATADMKLMSNQIAINTLRYTIRINRKEKGIEYTIDSVSLIRKDRGIGTTTISSEELVSYMEITGPVASQTEKQLNEIDMRFQQLMDYFEAYVKGKQE
jgi:hypothetical protein